MLQTSSERLLHKVFENLPKIMEEDLILIILL